MTKINKNSFILNNSNLSCDYLVIGSGAGGSVAASEIVESGKDCILVEEGDFYEIDHFKGSFTKSITATWRNAGFTPVFGKPSFAFAEGRCLGGSTYINGGLIWRTPKKILEKWNENHLEKYDYESLEEHFVKIENKLNVITESNDDGLNLDSKIIHESALKKNIKSVYVPRAVMNCRRKNVCYTGCASGAKQSVLQAYTYDSSHRGLRIIVNSKVKKINFKNNEAYSASVLNSKTNEKFDIRFKKIILACGVMQTPLLINSSFGKKIFNFEMSIHLNLRISAIFKNRITAKLGTMFTTQIQEFIDNGDIFMSTNFNKSNFLSSISSLDNLKLNELLEHIDNTASFVLQTKPTSKVKVVNTFNKHFLRFSLNDKDFINIKEKLKYFSNFLFSSGADKVILPIKGNIIISNKSQIDHIIQKLRKKDLQMLSVHGMSSIPMSKHDNQFLNCEGRSRSIPNLYITDASILPTNIGESPQGTIMAFSHEIMKRMSL
jgi:choline dehydrogenase-like flavoprotein